MPKDEFDFEDPFELNGMALLTREDTSSEMAECFIEEYMRMGYGHKQLLALFRNPHYLGPHMVFEKKGEPFIRDLIAEVFARWGRPVRWGEAVSENQEQSPPSTNEPGEGQFHLTSPQGEGELPTEPCDDPGNEEQTDPMGAPIPNINL